MFFSPVGTTEKVARGIAMGLDAEHIEIIDLCIPAKRTQVMSFSAEDLVLMVFPVYAGRVVQVPRYMLKTMEGHGAKCITVVTYGNRAYDDALLELFKLSENAGFEPIGAAAFVCEHSFDIGLAKGRPSKFDIDLAKAFGHYIREKFQGTEAGRQEALEKLNHNYYPLSAIPGNYPFKTQFRHDFGGP